MSRTVETSSSSPSPEAGESTLYLQSRYPPLNEIFYQEINGRAHQSVHDGTSNATCSTRRFIALASAALSANLSKICAFSTFASSPAAVSTVIKTIVLHAPAPIRSARRIHRTATSAPGDGGDCFTVPSGVEVDSDGGHRHVAHRVGGELLERLDLSAASGRQWPPQPHHYAVRALQYNHLQGSAMWLQRTG